MIYEYICNNCGNLQEEIHSMKDNPEIKCNDCTNKMQRVITGGTGIIFKGGGWTTSDSKFKNSMIKKNQKMKTKMIDHQKSVSNLNDLKKHN
jgi:putative FmdB family regulatory protein